jgi:hypothetical protein
MRRDLVTLLLLLPFSLLLSKRSEAQGTIADTSRLMTMFAPNYAFHLPGGDLKDRFGPSSNIALRAGIKLRSGFQFDLSGSFIFGNNVKNTDQLLTSLKTSQGIVLTENGERAVVQYFERGFTITLDAGYLFPLGYNPNSGILVKAGGGFLQHNIRYEMEQDNVPQLKDDRKAYFDRRASGFTFHEFLGYQHMANNGVANFFIGVEAFQAFPKPRRSYNVDDMQRPTGTRFDMLYGIRAGYVLSIYERESEERYYY